MSISSFLLVDEWNKTTGQLSIGDEVTVNGEVYIPNEDCPTINENSHWGVVTKSSGVDLYTVEDIDGNQQRLPCSLPRLCKRHTICCAHVSDNKKHDRYAAQYSTTYKLKWLEDYPKEEFPQDIPKGKIIHLHQHSDNTGQHFKSTGALEFYISLVRDQGGPTKY
eukprot:7233940-Ditylum_brightwellii.AAC.1